MKNVAGNNPFQINYQMQYNSASQSPDGLPSFLLRSQQSTAATLPGVTNNVGYTPVMGVNSTSVVNSGSTTSILPGFGNFAINPDYPVDLASNADFTIEQPLKWNSALRVSYVYSHGGRLDQYFNYNNHPSSFVYEMQNGKTTPNGGASVIGTSQANTYSSTATGPYDQTTWGGNSMSQKSGWSNDNQLQASYQKLYHHGVAWMVMYDWQKNLRDGGNWSRDNQVDPYANYANSGLSTYSAVDALSSLPVTPALPPPPPTGTPNWAYYKALNRFENYGVVDTATPKQQLQYNYVVDLPFGRGKHYFGNVNRLVDELVGGYQIAGDGNLYSSDFTITATNWGPTSPLKTYKHGVPITDCRSGVCYNNYLWWNGYIAPSAITGNSCPGAVAAKEVSNLPSNYTPYQTPTSNNCTDTTYYGQNEVSILLPGLHREARSPTLPAQAPHPAPAGPAPTPSRRPSSTDRSISSTTLRSSRSFPSPSASTCGSTWTSLTCSTTRDPWRQAAATAPRTCICLPITAPVSCSSRCGSTSDAIRGQIAEGSVCLCKIESDAGPPHREGPDERILGAEQPRASNRGQAGQLGHRNSRGEPGCLNACLPRLKWFEKQGFFCVAM